MKRIIVELQFFALFSYNLFIYLDCNSTIHVKKKLQQFWRLSY